MKKISSIMLLAGGLFAANIQRPPVAFHADATAAKTVAAPTGKKLKVNTAESKLGWIGTKPSGKHNGTLSIKSGKVATDGTTITGGDFVLDMNSISVSDLTGKGKEGLENHLKTADFFDVAKNPTATFAITEVVVIDAVKAAEFPGTTHVVAGNLTMHGETKNVSFPAKVSVSKKKITAEADFNIDRTQWGMNYGADGKVNKDINLKLNLVAGK